MLAVDEEELVVVGGNINIGEGSSKTDDIGDNVGEGKKQPVFNWLGEINVGVLSVVELLKLLLIRPCCWW